MIIPLRRPSGRASDSGSWPRGLNLGGRLRPPDLWSSSAHMSPPGLFEGFFLLPGTFSLPARVISSSLRRPQSASLDSASTTSGA